MKGSENMEEGKLFYNKNDVCEILGVADSKAYKIIKQLMMSWQVLAT